MIVPFTFSTIIIPLTLLLISLIFFFFFFSKPHPSRLPPGPFALPIIGHLHLLSPLLHQSFHTLSLHHGPLFSLRLGSLPCLVASTPSTALSFLKTHDLAFSNRPQTRASTLLTYNSSDFSFAPHGPYWSFIKHLCMSHLLGAKTLQHHLHVSIRQQENLALMQALRDKAEKKVAVDVREELMRLSNDVICRMTMSRRCSEGGEFKMRELVEEIEVLIGMFNVADFIGWCKNMDLQGIDKRLEDVHRRFDTMMEGILKEKEAMREKGEGVGVRDLLDMLIDISEDENAEVRLTRENIKAFILDLFAAGTDTSALTIEWALSELINHPTILRKAQDEIDRVVGKNRLVEESDLPNLTYLHAIVKETLRLHPTGPLIARVSNRDCEINGYEIPANTTVYVNVWSIGRDPNHWSEPLEFRPDRFIENPIDFRGQHYHLLPFGSGRRSCPGTSLAMLVIQVALAGMIQCFEWEVTGASSVDMDEGPGLTMPRANPLVCTPVARLDPMPWP